MARGRKPAESVVVPMKDDGDAGHNLQARAIARAAELRPEGLLDKERWVYDRLAPHLCHPTKARLNEINIFMFVQLCRSVVRYEDYQLLLAELGETYTAQTRNGIQIKSRPEIAQLNETWRQIRALGGDFGMTPAAERSLGGGGQLGFTFPDNGDDFT
ncbi:P27 family phage terminase small subunit [Paracoccus aminophilus]|uniref:Phage terminase, small subunit n=1 Tax=Paracoccus aminophilus JCM 7686 TaxID=1367847 RepID=S5YSX6_PARAH|nr:P27 family phage terminase small subunit [Paracoccus aminophilus]AGT08341.1 phage terminase, small subunit [Paracoccus aminophilus JCM 7686]AGT10551.1 phage terminase, small subunit [Paracoccus aminophilus JCM 7686]